MKRAIIGAGSFARELGTYFQRTEVTYFVEKGFEDPSEGIFSLDQFNPEIYEVVIAIADPMIRFNISKKLPKSTKYFTFIAPDATFYNIGNTKIGTGSIICSKSVISDNVTIGNHCHINSLNYIGHDTVIENYSTTAPCVSISGFCKIGSKVHLGIGSSIKQDISICDDVVVGLNGGVVKDITEKGTYVGTPAKKI